MYTMTTDHEKALLQVSAIRRDLEALHEGLLRGFEKPTFTEWNHRARLAGEALAKLAGLESRIAGFPPSSTASTPPTPLEILALDIPAISGGSPEPFEPTPADWREYSRWSERVEALDSGRAWDRDQDALHRDLYGY